MASSPDRRTAALAIAATLLSAIAWWHGTSLQPLWWAAWLAPLPLLAVSPRLPARWTALASLVAFAAGSLNQWHYLVGVIGLPVPAMATIVAATALAMTLVVLLFRALAVRGRALAAALSVPLAATGLSWLSALLSPHGTFGHIAYTQMDVPVLLQVAALVGLWGVGFLVLLGPATLAAALCARAGARARLVAGAAGATVLVAALVFGAWRLHDDAPVARQRVALIDMGSGAGQAADVDSDNGQRLLAGYAAELARLAADQRIDLAVLPESTLLLRERMLAPLQALADRHGIRIVVGVEDHSGSPLRNSALVLTPGAPQPQAYFKRHLVPGFEDRYTPGDSRLLLAGSPATAVAICKDLDFTATAREHARLGVQLLAVPAWDFSVDAWMHGRMAAMRGIEGGFAIARVARDGDLMLSDDRGRVLAEASAVDTQGPVSLVADLPLRNTRTPYRLWGDAFGALCLALAVLLATSLLRGSAHPPRRG